jgi:glucose-1-phosphate cytidylyltransferase
MMYFSVFGFREFAIALGYKGDYIKRWFADYAQLGSDLTVDTGAGKVTPRSCTDPRPDWRVHLIDTGQETGTAGRIRQLAAPLGPEPFVMAWGDALFTVDLRELVDFHRSHDRLVTITAVRPPARFGHLEIDGDVITEFSEKPQIGEGWINGAVFVMDAGVVDYIEHDEEMIERGPLERLADDGQLRAYRHEGFWQCMDTLRDKRLLDELWESGAPPWKRWS